MKHEAAKIKHERLTLMTIPLAFIVVCGLIQWLNQNDWASLHIQTTLSGEWWRIVTGHLVHFDWQHYVMNMTGLSLCVAVFYQDMTWYHWPVSALCLSIFSSIGLLILYPLNHSYVGFSDVLHGWIMLGAIAIYTQEKKLALTVFCLFWLKIIEENLNLPFFTSFGLEGGSVAKESHILGAVGGILYAMVIFKPFRQQ